MPLLAGQCSRREQRCETMHPTEEDEVMERRCKKNLSVVRSIVLTVSAVALLCQVAMAEGPAVSRINGKVEGLFGKFDSEDAYISLGSLTLPAGEPFGIQIDAAYGKISADDYGGLGLHAFWRDPDKALLGITAAYQAIEDIDLIRTGFEMEHYGIENFILRGAAGYQWGDVPHGVYASVGVNYYPTAYLMVGAESELARDDFLQTVAIEVQPMQEKCPGLSLVAEGALGEDNYDRFVVGIRYYFGEKQSLRARHRNEDPPSLLPDGMLQLQSEHEEEAEERPRRRKPCRKYPPNGVE